MDFLVKDQNIRVIPGDVKEISEGKITEIFPNKFSAVFNTEGVSSLEENTKVEIIIPSHTCIARFETVILCNGENTVTFSLPKEVKYIQRREYARIDLNIPVQLKDSENETLIKSVSKNLSAGGMQIISPHEFETGLLVNAEFSVLNKKNIKTVLEILRTEEGEVSKEYFISGRFSQISNSDKTAIIHLCLKKQLEHRWKNV